MTGNSQITFVCCLESGWLEDQTVRIIESLCRFHWRITSQFLNKFRTRQESAYKKSCQVIGETKGFNLKVEASIFPIRHTL